MARPRFARILSTAALAVTTSACAPARHGTPIPPQPPTEAHELATPAGSSAEADRPAAQSPTETLELLRAETVVLQHHATPERCRSFADDFLALYHRHGTPYVTAVLEAAELLYACDLPVESRELLTRHLPDMPRWARARALNTLGVLANDAGRPGDAIVHLQASLSADPALLPARANLVRILLRFYEASGADQARDDATHLLDQWQELRPFDPSEQLLRARLLLLRARDEPRLARTLELMLLDLHRNPEATDPQRAEALVLHARLLLRQDELVAAAKASARAVDLDPTHGPARLLTASCRIQMRDFNEAERMLTDAGPLMDPADEPQRLRLLAVALRGLRKYDEALTIYETLLDVPKPDPTDILNRAYLEQYRAADAPEDDRTGLHLARSMFDALVTQTEGSDEHREVHDRARRARDELDQLLAPSP